MYPRKERKNDMAYWKYLGPADSLTDAYKYMTSKAPSVSYWVTLASFDPMNPDYSKVMWDVQYQDGKRWWKDPVEAKNHTYWVVDKISGHKKGGKNMFTISDSKMKSLRTKKSDNRFGSPFIKG